MLRTLAAGIALLALASACSDGNAPADGDALGASPTVLQPVEASCAPARPLAAPLERTLDVAGVARSYALIAPSAYDGASPAPLLVVFNDTDAADASSPPYAALAEAAGAAGMVTAILEAAGSPPAWNDLAIPAQPDDAAWTRTLLDSLRAELCIDEHRIFVAGFGNGGGMAVRAACQLPDVVAAVGVVAATFPNCRADVPLIAFHGIDDAIVPFEGSASGVPAGERSFLQVRRAVSEWAREVGCDGLPTISRPSPDVELATFARCRAGDGETVLYTIVGGGHTWPGVAPADPSRGYATQEISAADTLVDFFAQHPPKAPSQADAR
jgi:polyhydroxybutyrate depolymerase